jgi:hypothetical protein
MITLLSGVGVQPGMGRLSALTRAVDEVVRFTERRGEFDDLVNEPVASSEATAAGAGRAGGPGRLLGNRRCANKRTVDWEWGPVNL